VERLIAAGMLSSEAALAPERSHIDEPSPTHVVFAPIQVEVPAAPGVHPVAPDPEARPSEDVDRQCPTCQHTGRVDLVDLIGHTSHLTCESCGTMWQVRSDH
jgi:hypothetical protein